MSAWISIGNDVEYVVFANGKVGHTLWTGEMAKAFYDGVYLGAHEEVPEAREAVELIGAKQPAKPLHPVPNYR